MTAPALMSGGGFLFEAGLLTRSGRTDPRRAGRADFPPASLRISSLFTPYARGHLEAVFVLRGLVMLMSRPEARSVWILV